VQRSMNEKGQFTIGIDLGGTSTRVGLYGSTMQLVDSYRMPTRVSAGPSACVGEMAGAIFPLLRNNGIVAGDVLGIGIGSPGPINLHTGVLGVLPNLPGWENFPLRDALAEAAEIPTILESDANAAAIAEWKFGAGQESVLDTMAVVTLGTGVGSGLILGGRVWHGMSGMGGEVGHATVDPNGVLCNCGSRGCLEMYASANGLLRSATEIAKSAEGSAALRKLVAEEDSFTPQEIASLAEREDDRSARIVFERMGFYLGIGIANLINTLDLPIVIVGGGVASAWPLFAPEMFRAVREFSVVYRMVTPSQNETLEWNRTFIRPALLGPSAGLLGAGLLPRLAAIESTSVDTSLTPEMA